MVESVTGAQSLVRSLEALGVEVMFGIPGGAILPAYDPIFDSSVRHILVRHEQGAGHAATGYAQATGKVGVCIATSGPGRDEPGHADRRRVHGLGGDGGDHRPGAAAARSARTRFQEADIHGITLPITKHNYLVPVGRGRARAIMAEAFHLAGTGRPGPVLVDVPKDVLQARTELLLAADAGAARLPADAAAARQADPRGGPADGDGPPAGALRRRRRAQGRRVGRAAASWPS